MLALQMFSGKAISVTLHSALGDWSNGSALCGVLDYNSALATSSRSGENTSAKTLARSKYGELVCWHQQTDIKIDAE